MEYTYNLQMTNIRKYDSVTSAKVGAYGTYLQIGFRRISSEMLLVTIANFDDRPQTFELYNKFSEGLLK